MVRPRRVVNLADPGRRAPAWVDAILGKKHYICIALWVAGLFAYYVKVNMEKELVCQADPQYHVIVRTTLNMINRHSTICQEAIKQEAVAVAFVISNIFGMGGLFGYFLKRELGDFGMHMVSAGS